MSAFARLTTPISMNREPLWLIGEKLIFVAAEVDLPEGFERRDEPLARGAATRAAQAFYQHARGDVSLEVGVVRRRLRVELLQMSRNSFTMRGYGRRGDGSTCTNLIPTASSLRSSITFTPANELAMKSPVYPRFFMPRTISTIGGPLVMNSTASGFAASSFVDHRRRNPSRCGRCRPPPRASGCSPRAPPP